MALQQVSEFKFDYKANKNIGKFLEDLRLCHKEDQYLDAESAHFLIAAAAKLLKKEKTVVDVSLDPNKKFTVFASHLFCFKIFGC